MYALRTSAAISGKRGGVPVSFGKTGAAIGLALGCAFPVAIPFMLGAVGAGMVVAKKKIDYYQAIEDGYAQRERERRGR